MVGETRVEGESEWAAMSRVVGLLGVGTPETIRNWVRGGQIDAGSRVGTTGEESKALLTLKCDGAELKWPNAILRSASSHSGSQRNAAGETRLSLRPSSTGPPVILDFVREHADHHENGGLRWGVEPICSVLNEHRVLGACLCFVAKDVQQVRQRQLRLR